MSDSPPPSEPMVCPECKAKPGSWIATPYQDTASEGDFDSSLVVPQQCADCGATFEVVYEPDHIAH